jgi:hypothetical protein
MPAAAAAASTFRISERINAVPLGLSGSSGRNCRTKGEDSIGKRRLSVTGTFPKVFRMQAVTGY